MFKYINDMNVLLSKIHLFNIDRFDTMAANWLWTFRNGRLANGNHAQSIQMLEAFLSEDSRRVRAMQLFNLPEVEISAIHVKAAAFVLFTEAMRRCAQDTGISFTAIKRIP